MDDKAIEIQQREEVEMVEAQIEVRRSDQDFAAVRDTRSADEDTVAPSWNRVDVLRCLQVGEHTKDGQGGKMECP